MSNTIEFTARRSNPKEYSASIIDIDSEKGIDLIELVGLLEGYCYHSDEIVTAILAVYDFNLLTTNKE